MNPPLNLSAAPPGLADLTELALDLRWSWSHASDELWRRLDPTLWALTYHPNVVLQTVSRETLAKALADPDYCRLLDDSLHAKRQAAATPAWFQARINR